MKRSRILCVAVACVTLFSSADLLRAADRNEKHVLLTNNWFIAAKTNAKDDIEKAIASKDDPNQGNKWKETALHVAVMYNSVEAAQAMLAHGANVNAIDEKSRIPLQYALNDSK